MAAVGRCNSYYFYKGSKMEKGLELVFSPLYTLLIGLKNIFLKIFYYLTMFGNEAQGTY